MGKLTKEIDNYLTQNPIQGGITGCYDKAADKFKVDKEYIRDRWRKLKKRNAKVEQIKEVVKEAVNELQSQLKENVQTGQADYTFVTKKRITTLEELVEACNIDTKLWNVVSYEINKWEVGRKQKAVELTFVDGVSNGAVKDDGTIFVEPLFQVKAKLSRRNIDKDLPLQKEAVMSELRAFVRQEREVSKVGVFSNLPNDFETEKKKCALEINIPDLHIGKLSWREETGDDYDINIAVTRYKVALRELLSRTNVSEINRFILVVGHDFLNVDGKNNMTTAGTPQSSDSRFYKMVKVGKKLLIDTINDLAKIAFVDVMVVPGNHDTNTMLMMGDILEAYYTDCPEVRVFNGPAPRKYYQFGRVGIMYAHGHNERLEDMGSIFAAENKRMWADTDFHRVHVGHFHHSKQIKYKDIQEKIGCVIKIISSLSSNDAWHTEKAYLSQKGAEAFLYHEDKGLIASYNYNI